MNKVILIGRLAREVELKQFNDGTAHTQNAIAVRRNFKNRDGEYDADFINFKASGKTAELLANYVRKGDMFGIVGNWRKDTYTKDGQKRTVDFCVAENIHLLQLKTDQEQQPRYNAQSSVSQVDPNSDLPF